jgi:ankyrin repeat protein
MAQHFHIGSDEEEVSADWSPVPTEDGRMFYHRSGVSEWGSITSVFEAAMSNDLVFLRSYHSARGDLGVTDPQSGMSAMHYAVAGGNLPAVQFLSTAMPRPHAPDRNGVTPLMLASGYGFYDLVYWLLVEARADVTMRDKDGNGALHFAAQIGNLDCLSLLIESMARSPLLAPSMWRRNNMGWDAYDVSILNGHQNLASHILTVFGHLRPHLTAAAPPPLTDQSPRSLLGSMLSYFSPTSSHRSHHNTA